MDKPLDYSRKIVAYNLGLNNETVYIIKSLINGSFGELTLRFFVYLEI